MKKQWIGLLAGTAFALPMVAGAQLSQTDAPAAESPASGPPNAGSGTLDVPASESSSGTTATASARPVSRFVEEVVVTAQKREENIQDVPISITAFSSEKLEALGVQTAEDLEHVTPGLTITNAAGFNVAYLRGVGTDAFLPGADPSVPFYLDGVPLLGAQGSSDSLGRVERVEVLKGPQGTLFGRNSTGGAISIVTPNPNQKLSGDLNVEYGNYAARKALGYLNVPITDKFAVSISAFGITQNNFVTNDTGPIIGIYSWGGRVKLRWDVDETKHLTLAGSYQQGSNNAGLAFENTRVAPDFRAVLPQDPKADRHVSFDSLAGARNESYLFSATYDQNTPWFDVKLIGSDQRLNAPFVQADFDKSDLPIVNIRSIKQLSKQTTAELQVLSNKETPFSDRFKWVGGFFFIKSSGGFDPIAFVLGPDAPLAFANAAGLGANGATNFLGNVTDTLNQLSALTGQNVSQGATVYDSGVLVSHAYSGYLQGTLTIIDSLDLTLGGRFQHEDRALEDSKLGVPTASGGERVLLSQSPPVLHSNQFSPRIALQFRPFGEGTQLYSSWARGYKSPTYNTVNLLGGLPTTLAALRTGTGVAAPDIQPLKAERVDTYELGVKTDLFDRSLRIDSAVFYTKQYDLLTGFVALESGGVVSYANAPAARIRGAETDITLTPLRSLDPGLVLTTSATYLDGKYTDYPNGKGFDTTTGLAFGPDGTEPLPARNFKGNRIVRTPNFTGNAGISQTKPLGEGSIEAALDGNYSSGFFFLPQGSDLYKRSPYAIFNGRITYIYDPWGLQMSAFCNNLLNREYNEVIFVDDFGRNQVLNAPRTYGVRGKLSF